MQKVTRTVQSKRITLADGSVAIYEVNTSPTIDELLIQLVKADLYVSVTGKDIDSYALNRDVVSSVITSPLVIRR